MTRLRNIAIVLLLASAAFWLALLMWPVEVLTGYFGAVGIIYAVAWGIDNGVRLYARYRARRDWPKARVC